MHSHWIFFINVTHTDTPHKLEEVFKKQWTERGSERKKLATVLNHNPKSNKNKARPHKQSVLILCSSDFTFFYSVFFNENHKVKCRFHCFDVEQRMEDISDKSMVVRAKIGKHKIGKGNKQLAVAEHSTVPQKADAEQHR